ncbi:MAG: hypothetical protein HPY59_00180 [Anaerolineae bacterium]|nr:hypothetical protein [Anaerolineae bacterium]
MKRKKIISLILFTNLLLMLACGSGGTTGSVSGSSMNCGFDACEGRFSSLKGTFSEEFEKETSEDNIPVSVSVSVEKGAVRFWVEDSNNNQTVGTASPGTPASIQGLAEVSFDEFKVYFEASEGEAAGVRFMVEY